MDTIFLRGIERILIVLGGIIFAYLGYRLYLSGIQKGKGELKAESTFYKLVFSGTGPGLFFMAFGGLILLTSLFTGGAEKTKTMTTSEQAGEYSKVVQTTEGQQSPAIKATEGEVSIKYGKDPIQNPDEDKETK